MAIRNLSTASISTGTKRSKFWDQTANLIKGFESIATQTASGSSTTITFSDVPTTYKYLQLHSYFALTTSDSDLGIRFNGDSTSGNYTKSQIFATGNTSTFALTTTSTTSGQTIIPGPVWYGNSTSGFVSSISHIYENAETDKIKTVQTLTGGAIDSGGAGQGSFVRMGLWNNSSSAVTSITLVSTGGNILSGSSFALYGIGG